jgi:hypothetical protein
MLDFEKIINIENRYYGYWRTGKLIPVYNSDYQRWWDIKFIGVFENKDQLRKQYPNTSIQQIEKAEHNTLKFVIEKIKEIDNDRTL